MHLTNNRLLREGSGLNPSFQRRPSGSPFSLLVWKLSSAFSSPSAVRSSSPAAMLLSGAGNIVAACLALVCSWRIYGSMFFNQIKQKCSGLLADKNQTIFGSWQLGMRKIAGRNSDLIKNKNKFRQDPVCFIFRPGNRVWAIKAICKFVGHWIHGQIICISRKNIHAGELICVSSLGMNHPRFWMIGDLREIIRIGIWRIKSRPIEHIPYFMGIITCLVAIISNSNRNGKFLSNFFSQKDEIV